jgi:hypothetical protein
MECLSRRATTSSPELVGAATGGATTVIDFAVQRELDALDTVAERGMELVGWPVVTISRGEIVARGQPVNRETRAWPVYTATLVRRATGPRTANLGSITC